MCVTQSDTFRYARLRYLIADDGFFGDGDGGQGRRHGGTITAWILQTASPYNKRNMCHTCLTCTRICAYIYDPPATVPQCVSKL